MARTRTPPGPGWRTTRPPTSRTASSSRSCCCPTCRPTTSTSPPVIPAVPDYEVTDADAALDTLIPDSANQPYDMHAVIETVLDDGLLLRGPPGVREEHHRRVRPGRRRARRAWWPTSRCTSPAAWTSTRRRRRRGSCGPATRSRSPSLTFVDVPGFLPGVTQEWAGHHPPRRQAAVRLRRGHRPQGHRHHPQGLRRRLRRHGLQAPRRRRQPRLAHRPDRRHGRRRAPSTSSTAANSPPPTTPTRSARPEHHEYEDTLANPYVAAERGYVDAVIRPAETRAAITRALISLRTKRETLPPKKHGNIPL